jgi:hypothetical protein
MRREHARERNEVRDEEWWVREGEDQRIQAIRDKMARMLDDAEISTEERKKKLALHKEEIEQILDERDEREHGFIEQELERHKLEQELENKIAEEEQLSTKSSKANEPAPLIDSDTFSMHLRARSTLNVSGEQMRKSIEENRKELNEAEQFSTILINSSERGEIPDFKKSRRKRAEPPEQIARIDTVVIKQREIGILYRESQEAQDRHLGKIKHPISAEEVEDDLEEAFEGSDEE